MAGTGYCISIFFIYYLILAGFLLIFAVSIFFDILYAFITITKTKNNQFYSNKA